MHQRGPLPRRSWVQQPCKGVHRAAACSFAALCFAPSWRCNPVAVPDRCCERGRGFRRFFVARRATTPPAPPPVAACQYLALRLLRTRPKRAHLCSSASAFLGGMAPGLRGRGQAAKNSAAALSKEKAGDLVGRVSSGDRAAVVAARGEGMLQLARRSISEGVDETGLSQNVELTAANASIPRCNASHLMLLPRSLHGGGHENGCETIPIRTCG